MDKVSAYLALLFIVAGLAVAAFCGEDDVPPLPQVVGWLEQYGWVGVPADEFATFSAPYSTEGSMPVRFEWEVHIFTRSYMVPPEYAGELEANLRIYVPATFRDSMWVTLRAIDADGNKSEFATRGGW